MILSTTIRLKGFFKSIYYSAVILCCFKSIKLVLQTRPVRMFHEYYHDAMLYLFVTIEIAHQHHWIMPELESKRMTYIENYDPNDML